MKLIPTLLGISLVATCAWAGATTLAQDDAGAKKITDEAVVAEQLPSYPLAKCIISGEDLVKGETKDIVHEGRLVRLCCGMCEKVFKKDSATFLAELDAAVVAAQKKDYPLDTCAVSGKELGSMGDPIEHVHGTRLVRFCCGGCVKAYTKNPEKFMAKVDAAYIEKQRKTYPLDTCVMSGEKLDDNAVDYLYGTRLVRLCCKNCKKAFPKNAEKHLAKVAEAGSAKKGDK